MNYHVLFNRKCTDSMVDDVFLGDFLYIENAKQLDSSSSSSFQTCVLFFTAKWCRPCQQVKETFAFNKLFSDEYSYENVKFFLTDVDEWDGDSDWLDFAVTLPTIAIMEKTSPSKKWCLVDRLQGSGETTPTALRTKISLLLDGDGSLFDAEF